MGHRLLCCCGDTPPPGCCEGLCDWTNQPFPVSQLTIDGVASSTGPTVKNSDCQTTLEMDTGGDAVCTLVEYSTTPCEYRWKIEHDGNTYYTDPVDTCGTIFSHPISIGPATGTIQQNTAASCHSKCCFPGRKLRVVTGGTCTVTGAGNVSSKLFSDGPTQWNYTGGSGCCGTETIDEYVADDDFASYANGVFAAILYDHSVNPKREVTQQELDDALAMDLTELANCQLNWIWEFYTYDFTATFRFRHRGPNSFLICGAEHTDHKELNGNPDCLANERGPTGGFCSDTYAAEVNLVACDVDPSATPFSATSLGCFAIGVPPDPVTVVIENTPQVEPQIDAGSSTGTCIGIMPFIHCEPFNPSYLDAMDNGARRQWDAGTLLRCERLTTDDAPCETNYSQVRENLAFRRRNMVIEQAWTFTEETIPCV